MPPQQGEPRVLSLLSASTEIVCRLGLGHLLVGRSHGCDQPPAVRSLPVVTAPKVDPTAPSEEIDAAVRFVVSGGGPVYAIHDAIVAELAPTVILTQRACKICAVTEADVTAACKMLPGCKVVTVEPTTLDDVFGDVQAIADALGAPERGERLVASMRDRLDAVSRAVAPFARQKACHLEWLSPVMGSGYWIAELLEAAGCEPIHAKRGEHCPTLHEAAALDAADVLILAPCGFSIARTRHELSELGLLAKWRDVAAVRAGRCVVADGNRFFNRSSCEIVDTCEMVAEMAFPELRGLWGHHGQHWVALDELDAFCDMAPRAPAGMPPAGTTPDATASLTEADVGAAPRKLVEAQLGHLRARDFALTFELCSSANRGRLASADNFATICSSGTFAVLVGDASESAVRLVAAKSASAATVRVDVCGTPRFHFDVVLEANGDWRTDGVRVTC